MAKTSGRAQGRWEPPQTGRRLDLTAGQREALNDGGRVRLDGQNVRAAARTAERQRANAALCKMPITEWLALPRAEKKRRLAAAREAGGR